MLTPSYTWDITRAPNGDLISVGAQGTNHHDHALSHSATTLTPLCCHHRQAPCLHGPRWLLEQPIPPRSKHSSRQQPRLPSHREGENENSTLL